MPQEVFQDTIRRLAAKDGRYHWRAFQFLYEGLTYTVHLFERQDRKGRERHVSGQELCLGLRDLALRVFGYMAYSVWESWGIRATDDWGAIVFLLVKEGYMSKTDADDERDFHAVFDLRETMETRYFADSLHAISQKPWPGQPAQEDLLV